MNHSGEPIAILFGGSSAPIRQVGRSFMMTVVIFAPFLDGDVVQVRRVIAAAILSKARNAGSFGGGRDNNTNFVHNLHLRSARALALPVYHSA
jgi:hypothetical protein